LNFFKEHGLPPTIPPPEWIHNVTCYSPLILDDQTALEKSLASPWTIIKVKEDMWHFLLCKKPLKIS